MVEKYDAKAEMSPYEIGHVVGSITSAGPSGKTYLIVLDFSDPVVK